MSDTIEIIYNKYIAEEKLKNGTKYEKLVAVVFKLLNQNDTVIHDLKLIGNGKTAQHQIDVTIKKNGEEKKILVECKDYNSVIGQGVVRDFHGAIHQIRPDDAFVVTTIGYTKGAIDFATDENIKLFVLREFQDEDWKGKMKKFNINLNITFRSPQIIGIIPSNECEVQKLNLVKKLHKGELYSPNKENTFFYDSYGNIIGSFQQIIVPIFKTFTEEMKKKPGAYEFATPMHIILFETLVCIKGFNYEFKNENLNGIIDTGEMIATLLLKSLDGSLNQIIFDQDLKKWAFNENEVVSKK
ncbi:MAG: restriction endonuclease [Clostridium sp.]|uniref:restriction endonuclease n=1 Tax=Clostridium sp. TaxID=1506 RepID=UPI003058AB66